MMEAVRILKALGIAPKRTIRIALWSGEEQGLLGSRAYVEQHFAKRAEPKDPEQAKLRYYAAHGEDGRSTLKPEHAKLSAYFNLDNGTGKIRGIYAQENAAVAPIFAAWLEPLHDLGATTVTMRNTGSTDHVSFDDVGLPGFQFIQDEVEYRTPHPPHQLGHLRAPAARRPDAGRRRGGDLRLGGGQPLRDAAAQADAEVSSSAFLGSSGSSEEFSPSEELPGTPRNRGTAPGATRQTAPGSPSRRCAGCP